MISGTIKTMKRIYFLFFLFAGLNIIGLAQDKNAEAIIHYTKAEEFYNQRTQLGAENALDELDKAESALGVTNPKILYLKIMAVGLFHDEYYNYDKTIWVKKFFELADVNSFPPDKYANILNSGYLGYLVKDTGFNRKIWTDSAFITENYAWSPSFQNSNEAYYKHAMQFYDEAYISTINDDQDKLWSNEEFREAYSLLLQAADVNFFKQINENSKKISADIVTLYNEQNALYYAKMALAQLSKIYYRGHGVIKNHKKALDYAIEANDTSQIIFLYRLAGESLIRDGNNAIEFCLNTVKTYANRETAIDSLTVQNAYGAMGEIYEKGLAGVPKDNYKAMENYINAFNSGCKFCDTDIENIMNNNSDNKTRKAVKELYNSWLKKNKR